MGRFQNSIALAKSSWQVLRDDKQLVVIPLLSLLATLVLAVAVLLPIGLIVRNGSGGYSGSKPLVWVLGFIGSVALTYVVVFFNAALVFAANSRFQGEPVAVGEAIHAAGARSHVLLPWAIVSATVSIVLRAVEQRGGDLRSHRRQPRRRGVVGRDVPGPAGPGVRGHRSDRRGEALGRALQAHLGREPDDERRHRPRRGARSLGRCGPARPVARRRRPRRSRRHRGVRAVVRRGAPRLHRADRDLPGCPLPLRDRHTGAGLRARTARGLVPDPARARVAASSA